MKSLNIITNIKACIFDMDGTLIDSLRIWDDIDARFFHIHDMEVPSDYAEVISHMSFMEMAIYTKEKYHFKESPTEIAATWIEWSKEAYLNTIEVKPGVIEFLSYLKSIHMPLSLATTNRKDLYEPCLRRNKLDSYFDHIANVNDLNTTKSEPKIYLHLAEKMNALAKETLVFEDILTAVKTAHEATFKVALVYDEKNKFTFEESKQYSDHIIYDYRDLLK